MLKHFDWIDTLKALCMIGVFLCHTEAYYYNRDSDLMSLGYWVKPFYVNAFFFVSGYLFYGKWLKSNLLNTVNGGYLDAIRNLLFRLVVPTLIFSTLFFIPKLVFHGNDIGLTSYFIHVLGGISYWFTSALAVAQLILLSLVFLSKKRNIQVYLVVSFLLFVLGTILNQARTSTTAIAFFPWFYQTGLEYTLVMVIGGVYMKYEGEIDKVLKGCLPIVLIVYVGVLSAAWMNGIKLRMIGLGGEWNLLGLIAVTSGIILLVAICKWIRPVKGLSYIGKNSILFYFLSGVIPAMLGAIAYRLMPEPWYGITLILTVAGVICSSIVAYIIKRYLPFMVDLRILFDK